MTKEQRERLNPIIKQLERFCEETGVVFVLLESENMQAPFSQDWTGTAESAVERLNAAFEHTPLRFSCEVRS